MAIDPPPEANFYGLGEPSVDILFLVTRWRNGLSFSIRGEQRSIGTHHEPALRHLFKPWNAAEFTQKHEDAHERMLSKGLLQEDYLCRRKVDWLLTEDGLKAVNDIFDNETELRPEWADDDADGPLYTDPNELIPHRKGVEVAENRLRDMAWAYDIENHGRPYGIEWYPTDGKGQKCHDLHIDTQEHMTDIGVEVITESNNQSRPIQKWERFRDEDRLTLWVFDNRETACDFFNTLDSTGYFRLDGAQFNNPSNWSQQEINRKIRRSAKANRKEPVDLVHTITGMFKQDHDDIYEVFENSLKNIT